MIRIIASCLGFLAAGLVACGDEPSRAATVKKLAEELAAATVQGDFAKLMDHTCDSIVKELGGRKKAIETTAKLMSAMKEKGFVLKGIKVGDPGEFHAEGGNIFVVVPMRGEMTIPDGKAITKSYLLGISSDGGKTWKFADGAGMDKLEARDKLLPKLPAKLKLPAKEKPEIIKDN